MASSTLALYDAALEASATIAITADVIDDVHALVGHTVHVSHRSQPREAVLQIAATFEEGNCGPHVHHGLYHR
jgi:hypothetical protein